MNWLLHCFQFVLQANLLANIDVNSCKIAYEHKLMIVERSLTYAIVFYILMKDFIQRYRILHQENLFGNKTSITSQQRLTYIYILLINYLIYIG